MTRAQELSTGIVEAAERAGHPEAHTSFWYRESGAFSYFLFYPDDPHQNKVKLPHDGIEPDFDLIYLQLMVLVP